METKPETKTGGSKNLSPVIVKHSNELAMIPLSGFSAQEIDLFFGLCYFLQGQKDNEVTISFSDVRNLLGFDRRGNSKLFEALYETSQKFGDIRLGERTATSFKIITPFIGFEADLKHDSFTVQAHKDFVAALNDLDGSPGKRYTLSDVRAISQLKSIFSKQALKMMFLYRKTGYWYVTVEELRYYLSIPDGYKQNDIKRRVIDVIRREMTEQGLFTEFEITENKDENKRTTGRRKVIGYTFHFIFSDNNPIEDMLSEGQSTMTCPKCGKLLFKIKRRDGSGYFFGHKGGQRKDAECRYTVSLDVTLDTAEITESADAGENKVDITKGDLERYYRYLRDTAAKEAVSRRERVMTDDPDLWRIYEEKERKQIDYVNVITSLSFSKEGKAEKEAARKEMREKISLLENALVERGLPKNYFEPQYKCEKCKDSGSTVDGLNCSCRKQRAVEAKEWLSQQK